MAFVTAVSVGATSATTSAAAVCERHTGLRGARVTPARSARSTVPARRSQVRMEQGLTLTESLTKVGNFTILLDLCKATGVDLDATSGTLFAPDNRAFGRLKPGTLEAWYKKPAVAKAILSHHFLPGQVLTLAKIKGCGFWDGTTGGPLAYEGLGAVIKVGGSLVLNESSNRECVGSIYHTIESLLLPKGVTPAGVAAGYTPSVPNFSESTVESVYPVKPMSGTRALEAASLSGTVGGRKAMGLMKDLPFWMYGPPFNAMPQEAYEPISIAAPSPGIGVDYQLMPPGSVAFEPDSVNANELNPISGMSKYIGKNKNMVEGKGESDYSKLDQASNTW